MHLFRIFLIIFFVFSLFSSHAVDVCKNFEDKLNAMPPAKEGFISDGQLTKKDLGLYFHYYFDFEKNEISKLRDQNNYPILRFSILNDSIPPNSSIISINNNNLSNISDEHIDNLILSNSATVKTKNNNYNIDSKKYDLYLTELQYFKINAIDEIKTKEGEFRLDYSFQVSQERSDWIDAGREIGGKTICSFNDLELKNLYYAPIEQTLFLNQFDVDEDKYNYNYDQIYSEKLDKTFTLATFDGVAKVKTDFDLKNFPFDKQILNLELRPYYSIDFNKNGDWDYPIISLINAKKNVYYDLNNYKKENFLKEWTISNINITNELNYDVAASPLDPDVIETHVNDFLSIKITVDRNTNYFIFKIIIPVFLILAIAWSVMWIPPNQVESRLTTSIVALLALIAYNFVFNEDIPKLSYLTSLDRYILLSYLFCAIPTFLTIYFSRLTKKDYNIALSVNKKSRLLGIIIYGITTTVIFSV